MKQKIIFFLIFAVIVSSCSITNTRKAPLDIRSGLDGLSLEFLKNTPPQKIFENDVFPAIIKVKNKGAYSIKGNDVAVLSLGVEKDYTKKVELLKGGKVMQEGAGSSAIFNLNGKSQLNPIGEEEIISYNIEAGKIDPQSEAHPSTVTATLCYPYETVLESTVCVDTDINNLRPGKKICSSQDLIFSNGQGSPVSITKIEPLMLPLQLSGSQITDKIKPQFLIYIENKGPGVVIKKESVKDFCTKSDTTYENFNIVYVDAFLSNKPLKCQLEKKEGSDELGHIKLKDNKDIIRCYLEEGVPRSDDPYLSPLKIVLKYGYTQSISASYFIQKPVS